MIINLICATGNSGQIGLNGELPWKNSPIIHLQRQARADLALFRSLTFGKDLVVGKRTADKLPELPGRTIHIYRGENPVDYLNDLQRYKITEIWIAGGAFTYKQFAPYINGMNLINRLDYNGSADAYFPAEDYGFSYNV